MTAPEDRAHDEFAQLAAGFALSALEPADEEAFRTHLPSCEQCATALLEHSTTLGHLAFAAGTVEPPASVLAGIRAGIRASAPGDLRPVEAPSAVASLADARAKRAGRTVRLSTALVGVAASLVLVLAMAFVGGGLGGNQQPNPTDVALQQLVSTLLVPGAKSVELDGEGQAVAVLNKDHVSLVLAGMRVNDRASSIYVLWGKSRYGGVRAVGTFDVASAKPRVINNIGSVSAGTLQLLMVTREQGRHAPAVTTQQPVLSGQV